MNYNKLWKLLIDRGMLKKDLQQAAGLSSNAIAKMGKGGDVSTQVLTKICKAIVSIIASENTCIPEVFLHELYGESLGSGMRK